MWNKKEEPDELSNKRVFSINHSDIPKGQTQCVKHQFKKINDTQVDCIKCMTSLIVNNADEYVK